MLANLLAW